MKKFFLFAAAALMMLATGCNLQPTQINPDELPDQVSIFGYVRYTSVDSKGKTTDPEVLSKQPVILYYGVKDGEVTNYKRYDLTTNDEGAFSIKLGVTPGKVIDEVKVQCSYYEEDGAYAYDKGTKKYAQADTEFYGEVSKKNLAAGNSYFYDLIIVPVAYTNNPEFKQPGEE